MKGVKRMNNEEYAKKITADFAKGRLGKQYRDRLAKEAKANGTKATSNE